MHVNRRSTRIATIVEGPGARPRARLRWCLPRSLAMSTRSNPTHDENRQIAACLREAALRL
ncbi:hypothetical protein KGP93_36470, partial [Burkholderia multivorans]|nr:hypothetical protein [Burkholderia multivorans]